MGKTIRRVIQDWVRLRKRLRQGGGRAEEEEELKDDEIGIGVGEFGF